MTDHETRGAAQPWLTNIADPANPQLVSQFGLEINNPENCPEQIDSRANQSVHYHDVDDPNDTTFVMASMWNAGVRVFDVRDPKNPTEVAYFNPGDVDPTETTRLDRAWAHVRYLPEKGHIWFATAEGGFWVVRLEGKVREYLDLDTKNVAHGRRPLKYPRGRSGTARHCRYLALPPRWRPRRRCVVVLHARKRRECGPLGAVAALAQPTGPKQNSFADGSTRSLATRVHGRK